MSVEALLSEVNVNLPITQVIKAAEQAYYKEHSLYSSISPEYHPGVTPSTSSSSHKKDKKGKKEKEAETDLGNPLQNAIDTVKGTISAALEMTKSVITGESGSDLDDLKKAVEALQLDNKSLRQEVAELRNELKRLQTGAKQETAKEEKKEQPTAAAADEDFDLFESEDEEESEEQKKVREQRLADYAAKKSKKPGPIAKSNIIYDVKPWDDTIDAKDIEKEVRKIEMDGLVWGASKVLPVAYGVMKLQICCVIEDDKVSSDWLEEKITDLEDLVQSVDVVAFNKV
jgi:elongation factor 1-delta